MSSTSTRLSNLEELSAFHSQRLGAVEDKAMALSDQETALQTQVTAITSAVADAVAEGQKVDAVVADLVVQIADLKAAAGSGSSGAELQPDIDALAAAVSSLQGANTATQAALAAIPVAAPPDPPAGP